MTDAEAVIAALGQVAHLADGLSANQLAAEPMRFRAVERNWVLAGNAAKAHAHATGLAAGAQPWSALAGIRDALAHHRIDEADPELLHQASTLEVAEILAAVRSGIQPGA